MNNKNTQTEFNESIKKTISDVYVVKETFKKFTLEDGEYLEDLFKRHGHDKFPVNTIINKGKCGVGGTTFEIKANRHSIILVPLRSIIESKVASDTNSLILGYDPKNKESVYKYFDRISKSSGYYKIFSTMEGLNSLIRILEDFYGKSIYVDFTILVDEYHTSITEYSYRKSLSDFSIINNFKNIILLSATSLSLSDPKFSNFQKIEITAPLHDDLLNLLHTPAPITATIENICRHGKSCDSHIFINSIENIRIIIDELKKKIHDVSNEDFSVWCSSTRYKDINRFTNEGISCNSNHSVINFYTSAYFEGWDLNSYEEVRMYLVSKANDPNMEIDIRTRGYQAFGRLRNSAIKFHHIFSTSKPSHNVSEVFSERLYTRNLISKGHKLIKAYKIICECDDEEMKNNVLEAFITSKSFENIIKHNDVNDSIEINYFGIDFEYLKKRSQMDYASYDSVKNAWKEMGFYKFYDEKIYVTAESDYSTKQRFTKKDNLDIFYRLNNGKDLTSELDSQKLVLYNDILKVANMENVEALKGDINSLKNILKKNYIDYVANNINDIEFKNLRDELNKTFKSGGEAYTKEIPPKLIECFIKAGINYYGNFTGSTLEKFFNVEDRLIKNANATSRSRGYKIISPKFK